MSNADASGLDRSDEPSSATEGGDHDRVPAGLEAARARADCAGGPASRPDDSLADKHKGSIDRDYRSLDYGNLDGGSPEARSAGQPANPPQSSTGGTARERAYSPQFADFGGSVVSADVVRGDDVRDAPNRPVDHDDAAQGDEPPSAGASRPNKVARRRVALGAPNPDGRTPKPARRAHAGPDPLAEKHKGRFDKDFRTLNYKDLSGQGASASPDVSGATPTTGEPPSSRHPGNADPGYAPGFQSVGSSGSVSAPSASEATAPDVGVPAVGDPTPAEAASAPPQLARPHNDEPDDLTRIRGIGPTLERRLFDNGIFHLAQIAAWSPAEAQWIDSSIGFAGRVEREEWVAQAKVLTGGTD